MKKDDDIFLPQRSVSLSTVYDLEHQPSSTQAETVVHPVTDAAAPPNFCVCILMEVLSSSARTSHPHHSRGNSCTPGPRRSSLTLRPRSRKLLTIIEGSCSRSYTVPWDFYSVTMILQRIRTIVGDAEFEPGTSAPEVWCAIPMSHHISKWTTIHVVDDADHGIEYDVDDGVVEYGLLGKHQGQHRVHSRNILKVEKKNYFLL